MCVCVSVCVCAKKTRQQNVNKRNKYWVLLLANRTCATVPDSFVSVFDVAGMILFCIFFS